MPSTMLKTLTPSARILALFIMALGPSLPTLAGPEQKGRQFTEEREERIVAPLLDQIAAMDLGLLERSGDSITLTQADGTTYVFENIGRAKSGENPINVSVYGAEGQWLHTITFNKGIQVIDDNRIDFEAVVSSTSKDSATTISGSLSGLRGAPDKAVAMIAENQSATELVMIDFSGLPDDDGITTHSIVGEVGGAVVTALNPPAVVAIVAVVGFVALTCLFLGWWGC